MFEPDAIELIGQEGAQLLTGIVRGAWDELHEKPLGFFQRTRRQDMNDLMIQNASRDLLDLGHVTLHIKDTIYWYVWNETAAIRFKHHRENGKFFTKSAKGGASPILGSFDGSTRAGRGATFSSSGCDMIRECGECPADIASYGQPVLRGCSSVCFGRRTRRVVLR